MQVTTPSCKWVCSKVVDILRVQPNMGTKELQTRIENDLNNKCTIGYDTIWLGKQRALEQVYGKWSESFELLFRWKPEVMKRSPGSEELGERSEECIPQDRAKRMLLSYGQKLQEEI
jgi:hypothetical protein